MTASDLRRLNWPKGTWFFSLIPWLAVVLTWFLVSRATPVIPGPIATFEALLALAREGTLLPSLGASIKRIGVGYLLAVFVALPLGLICGFSEGFRSILSPVIEMLRPISAIAWIPMAIMWFGITEEAAYFLIWYGSFFPIFLNTVAGVRRVPRQFVQASRTLGASWRGQILEIILPGALPTIVAGFRVGLGLAIAVIIAAELGIGYTLGSGLGYLLLNYSVIVYSPDRILAVIAVIGLLGLLVDRGLAWAERHVIRWRQ